MPALGRPTRPTSASNLSSKRSFNVLPGAPFSAILGARWTEETNLAFPRPPRPPGAITVVCPFSSRSIINLSVSRSKTSVPNGTSITKFSELAPN